MFNNINVSTINIQLQEQQQNYHNEKIHFFQSMIEQQPNNPIPYFNLARQYHKEYRYHDARSFYLKALQLYPNHEDSLYQLGLIYYHQKYYQDAISILEKLIQLNPQYIQGLAALGLIYFQFKNYEKSANYYRIVIEKDPNNAQHYYYLGCNIYQQGKSEQAINIFNRALQIHPLYASTYYHLGLCYFRLNMIQEALQCYIKTIELQPKNAGAYHNAAIALSNLQNRPGQSISYFLKAIELDPDNILYLTGLGNSYLQLNNFNMSIMYFRQVRQIFYKPEAQYQTYLKEKHIQKKNVQFIYHSINIFELNYGFLNQLKHEFQNDRAALEFINNQEKRIYQPLILLLKEQLKPDIINSQHSNIQLLRKNGFQFTKEEMNKRMQNLQRQIRKSTKKIKFLQKYLITKEQIDKIYLQLPQRTLQTQKKIKKLQQYFRPKQQLQDKIQYLKDNKMQKSAKFGQTIFWLLNSQINSYRMISQGIIQKGEQFQKGRVESVIRKLSSILNISKSIPIIGQACQLINYIACIYANESQSIMIQKISSMFLDISNDKLSHAISQVVLALLEDVTYMKILQSNTNSFKGSKILEMFLIIGDIKEKLISKVEGLESYSQSIEEVYAIADCSFIIKEIMQLKDKDIRSFKQQRKTDNFLLIVSDSLLTKRKNESHTSRGVKKQQFEVMGKKKTDEGNKCSCALI